MPQECGSKELAYLICCIIVGISSGAGVGAAGIGSSAKVGAGIGAASSIASYFGIFCLPNCLKSACSTQPAAANA